MTIKNNHKNKLLINMKVGLESELKENNHITQIILIHKYLNNRMKRILMIRNLNNGVNLFLVLIIIDETLKE